VEITTSLKTNDLLRAPNIATLLTEQEVREIGLHCKQGFDADLSSRSEWDRWYGEAMKLALQVTEAKTFPWPNCANVKFPLVTIAAINFHARAYPALINGQQVVKYRVSGEDKDGNLSLRAKRITDHSNEQLLERSDWEAHQDKALIVVPIMGCAFKKTRYDATAKTTVSRLVLPQNLVVPYYTASLKEAVRISEIYKITPNGFITGVRRGLFIDQEYVQNYQETVTAMLQAERQAQRITPVAFEEGAPTELVEQHCFLDLDGDGYAEPYIVTFVRHTGQLCRIVARYYDSDIEKNAKGEIAHIEPEAFYTKLPFIPSPDGGFYDMGLGMLLGPLNAAVDTLINQLLDAGTMSILGGGFFGRGVKIRRGDNTMAPYEWKQVDSTGASLKDNIVPLPFREPSMVLFELLTFLVSYGERIGSANEVQMGEVPGQNTKAEVFRTANVNGQRVFAAIYKRMWRSMKEEFTLWYQCTARAIERKDATVLRLGPENIGLEDYRMPVEGVFPAADPNIVSMEENQRIAELTLKTALSIPGHNVYKAVIRFYKAFNVANPEEIFPDPTGPNAIQPAPGADLVTAQAKMLSAQTAQMAMANNFRIALGELMRKAEETRAVIRNLEADSILKLKDAEAKQAGQAIALINAELSAHKQGLEGLEIMINLMQGQLTNATATESKPNSPNSGSNGMGGMAKTAPDAEILRLPAPATGSGEGELGTT
jgi:chaperonin GroES